MQENYKFVLLGPMDQTILTDGGGQGWTSRTCVDSGAKNQAIPPENPSSNSEFPPLMREI